MEKLIVLVSVCLVTVFAQKFGFGSCPNAKPLAQLDINRYLGKWYEIYKFNSFFEINQECITANYSIKADGHIKVFNRGTTNGKEVSAVGDAYLPNATLPAQLAVRFATGAPYGPYWVLDTDYTNYSVVFSCEALTGLAHAEFAWILSRKNTISAELKQQLFQKFTDNGVDTSALKQTVQTNCSY
ncbi:hypothetical protein SNE40_010464 [Patella caerulea]|uniref:Apolipoprotein D n=1 Tax=Patella caerulea TaxID=87958 RepID=A0AAN8PUM2_PATCE